MPNLKPPITTTDAAVAYQASILKALPANSYFTPLMTLYLTDNVSPERWRRLATLMGGAAGHGTTRHRRYTARQGRVQVW
ncbi:hypothetical protein QJS04_geneDACA017267 [Acorus gramineus]|uniref:Dihydroorotase n=1 Tax=Acorus gramineus TaxID=55184 RepID=A0AAV9A2U9_ACOGR|nr:hypothetical protein QJS04_geneDACA017267 [Acorus gramineus]